MRYAVLCLALIACSDSQPLTPPRPPPARVPDTVALSARADYQRRRAALEADRRTLAEHLARHPVDRGIVLADARQRLERSFRNDLMPAWRGTTWAFSGTSAVPGQGTIACGHFVSTIIQHLGFDVDRIRLGQQASEYIARTFVPKSALLRFSNRSSEEVVAAVAANGDGIYALGLDRHAGFLDVHDGQVDMCHASNLDTGTVVCEPAAQAWAFVSKYRVAGRLFDDHMVEGWLQHRDFGIYRPAQ